jgi:ADP-ribose pyrophosphatase YjhB (NUDIX family)
MSAGRAAYRYCPYCRTELHDAWVHGRTRRVCAACGFVHFEDPKLGAAVLVEQAGQVLLVRRAVNPAMGAWCLPSGFVECDESPLQAALRECQEETGLQVEVTGLLQVDAYQSDTRGPGVVIFYRARRLGGTLRPGDDAGEVRFFGPQELPADIAFQSNRRVLAEWSQERLRLRSSATGSSEPSARVTRP